MKKLFGIIMMLIIILAMGCTKDFETPSFTIKGKCKITATNYEFPCEGNTYKGIKIQTWTSPTTAVTIEPINVDDRYCKIQFDTYDGYKRDWCTIIINSSNLNSEIKLKFNHLIDAKNCKKYLDEIMQ